MEELFLRDYSVVFQFDINGNPYYKIYKKGYPVTADDSLRLKLLKRINELTSP